MSTLLLGGSILLFLVGFIVSIPAVGNTLALLMFTAVASRFVFYLVLYRALQASKAPAARAALFQCIVWLLMAVAFFTFVVLHQFKDVL